MNLSPDKLLEPAWYCLRTQTKREHIAAQHLKEFEAIEVFCPRLRYRKPTRRGTIWWLEPMFPSYLLARFSLLENERLVCSSQGIRGIVKFGSLYPHIPESFIQTLQREILLHSPDSPDILNLTPNLEIGDMAEIANGPLQGLSGEIISISPAAERVKILLDFLGQTQPVDIDLFSLILPRRPSVPPHT